MSGTRTNDLRIALIQAGIEEINTYGANGLSLRRVATACNVSTAAPYKHFKDKKEFIAAIIDYVNEQWAVVQERVLTAYGWTPAVFRRKLHIVRSLLFGTMFMLDTGELQYSDETMANFRYAINREFDLP